MRVSKIMSMKEYDAYTREQLPGKIPDVHHKQKWRRLGDSIYDFSTNPPTQRKGAHGPEVMAKDLSGRNALLSDHFYYFGSEAVPLPENLRPIVLQGQGFKSNSNAPYVDQFVAWIESLGYAPNTLVGEPPTDRFPDNGCAPTCDIGGRRKSNKPKEKGATAC
jgi:hypothetical protein